MKVKQFFLLICNVGFILDILCFCYLGIQRLVDSPDKTYNPELKALPIKWLSLQIEMQIDSFFTIGLGYFVTLYIISYGLSKMSKRNLYDFVFILFPVFLISNLYFLFLILVVVLSGQD